MKMWNNLGRSVTAACNEFGYFLYPGIISRLLCFQSIKKPIVKPILSWRKMKTKRGTHFLPCGFILTSFPKVG